MVFQSNGNLVTYYGSQPLFNTSTTGRGALMTCLNQDPYTLMFDAAGNSHLARGLESTGIQAPQLPLQAVAAMALHLGVGFWHSHCHRGYGDAGLFEVC